MKPLPAQVVINCNSKHVENGSGEGTQYAALLDGPLKVKVKLEFQSPSTGITGVAKP